jgi:hypothetical protein
MCPKIPCCKFAVASSLTFGNIVLAPVVWVFSESALEYSGYAYFGRRVDHDALFTPPQPHTRSAIRLNVYEGVSPPPFMKVFHPLSAFKWVVIQACDN